MKFHDLNRGPKDNRYCGPAVISFISGINTSDAALMVRNLNPHVYRVRGTYPHEVFKVLNHLGYSAIRRSTRADNPTLKQWLRASKESRTPGRMYLLIAGNHWQLVMGRKYACGRIGAIVGLGDKRIKNRARVGAVYEIVKSTVADKKTARAEDTLVTQKRQKRAEANQTATARRRAQKIAKEYGFTIDVDRFEGGSMSIYFNVPEWMEQAREDGNLDFYTIGYDWFEAESTARELEEAYREGIKKGLDIEEHVA